MRFWAGAATRPHPALLPALALLGGLAWPATGLGGDDRAAGDRERGARVFERSCAVCHSPVAGLHKEGPSLAGIYGRRAGSVPFFANYRALKGLDIVWDGRSLDAWLADPQGFTGRSSAMAVKLADAGARADVIAYLKTLKE